jgi:uncharacterized protein
MASICGLPGVGLSGQTARQQSQVLGDAEDSMREVPFDVNKLVELCRQHDVQQVGVFGSSARGEADENSDIDLLISFSKRISLLQMAALERQFSHALGRKVDLLTEAAIRPYLRETIKRDVQVLYEAG